MAETRFEDDEWVPVTTKITNEQVAAIKALLAMPFVESDLQIFLDDDEPASPNPEESKP